MPSPQLRADLARDGIFNTRDLGGLPTRNGQKIAPHKLLRADALQRVQSSGPALREFGIVRVLDLRDDLEREKSGEIQVDENGVIGGGVHLRPEEVNKLVEERGDEVFFFDGRNAFEAKIGKFKNAVVPDITTSHDFVAEIESGKYDHMKDKPIVTYCTGGIRCEILSVVMKNRGFKEVYQVKGGIVRYGNAFGDDGLWEGSLYTFDDRLTIDFSDHTKLIGQCAHCNGPTKEFRNCQKAECHQLVLLCDACYDSHLDRPCKHDREIKRNRELIG